MSKIKKTLSILLAAVMLLGVFIVMPTGASAAAFKHEAFEITNPVKNGTYAVNKTMTIEIKRLKWIAATVNGFLVNDYNHIYIEISKDGQFKHCFEEEIFTSFHSPGTTATESFTPTELGTYTMRVGFATANIDRHYIGKQTNEKITDETYVGSFNFTVVNQQANPMTVKSAACTADGAKLKTAAVTVKPLTISGAKGAVTVSAIPSGTDAAIRNMITVNKTTGAITFKKGNYKPGTYKILLSVSAAGNTLYKQKYIQTTATVRIKGSNPITVTAGARKIKQSALKSSAVTIRPLTIAKAQGRVTVTKVKSGTTASIYNYITVNKTNGKITIRKGAYKKGTYAIKLNIAAAGNNNYKGKILTRTVKVTVY